MLILLLLVWTLSANCIKKGRIKNRSCIKREKAYVNYCNLACKLHIHVSQTQMNHATNRLNHAFQPIRNFSMSFENSFSAINTHFAVFRQMLTGTGFDIDFDVNRHISALFCLLNSPTCMPNVHLTLKI